MYDLNAPQEIVLGDYVETEHHGHRGRVYQVHVMGCPESDGWLAGQQIPVAEYKDQRWVSILVNGGGAVTAPSLLCRRVDPFPFENPWANQYFRKEEA